MPRASAGIGAAPGSSQHGQHAAKRQCWVKTGTTLGRSMYSCTLITSEEVDRPRLAAHRAPGQVDDSIGRFAYNSAVTFMSCPDLISVLALPGFDRSRRSLRFVLSGLDEVRDVVSGR